MLLRSQSDYEFSRERFIGLFCSLFAKFEVITNGFTKGSLQFADGFALESHNVANADNFAVKNIGFVIEFNFANVTFVLHHNRTPAEIKNRLIETKAPLSVSF